MSLCEGVRVRVCECVCVCVCVCVYIYTNKIPDVTVHIPAFDWTLCNLYRRPWTLCSQPSLPSVPTGGSCSDHLASAISPKTAHKR